MMSATCFQEFLERERETERESRYGKILTTGASR